jgi:hypothetical protein
MAYFEAPANLHSFREVLRRVFHLDPETGEQEFLSGPKMLLTYLCRTSLGFFWEPGYRGGADPYICNDDAQTLRDFIVDQAGEMNCLTK